jgi:hypothetical protein
MIPDGTYDVRAAEQRQWWRGGQLFGWCPAGSLQSGNGSKAFGAHPDIPKSRICISCGAREQNNGVIPCGH